MTVAAAIAAFFIAALGWLGISGAIDRNVEQRVQASVDRSVVQVLSDLNNRLQQIGSSAATVESSSLRVEAMSTLSAASAATAQDAVADLHILATQAAVTAGAGEWIVAIASEEQPEDALAAVDRAVRAGYQAVIYYFDGLFVPAIGVFSSREEADIARLAVASTLRVSPALHDLRIACPYRACNERGFFNCYLEPTPVPTP